MRLSAVGYRSAAFCRRQPDLSLSIAVHRRLLPVPFLGRGTDSIAGMRLRVLLLLLLPAAFLYGAFRLARPERNYTSAGILPLAVAPDGAVHVLLGIDAHTQRWADFGGGREAADRDPPTTACREFVEETAGLLPFSIDECAEQVRTDPSSRHTINEYKAGSRYISFHLFIQFDPALPERFSQLLTDARAGRIPMPPLIEKELIAWLPLANVLMSVRECCRRGDTQCDIGAGRLLRRTALSTLCLADANGHFDS